MADTLPISERITVEIEAIISETPDIKRFVLKSVTGDALPHFTGGSHIVFYLNEVACGWHNALFAAQLAR